MAASVVVRSVANVALGLAPADPLRALVEVAEARAAAGDGPGTATVLDAFGLVFDLAFRSTLHALATLRDFEHSGVGFSALTQPELDTTSAAGRLVFTILAAVAEMERELIADRVREGMRHAARQGKQIGRPPVTARPGFATRWNRVHPDLAAGRVSRRQAARRLGIGTATLARLLAADPGSGGTTHG